MGALIRPNMLNMPKSASVQKNGATIEYVITFSPDSVSNSMLLELKKRVEGEERKFHTMGVASVKAREAT